MKTCRSLLAIGAAALLLSATSPKTDGTPAKN